MSSCLIRSIIYSSNLVAEWIPNDADKPRKPLEEIVSGIDDHAKILNALPSVLTKIIVDYLESYACFGEREWTTLCGRVDPAPLLPHDFSAIWNGPCPIFPGKKIRQTHMLVYIPATVDGEPFTLKKLGEIAKRYFQENDSDYSYMWYIFKEFGDKSLDKSGWVLITKDLLPASINKSKSQQKKVVADLFKKFLISYEVPDTLAAFACILSQYFHSNIFLFSNNPRTYKRSKDIVRDLGVAVWGFQDVGIRVASYVTRESFALRSCGNSKAIL